MKLILVDPMPELCTAWTEHFSRLPNVEIVNGRFEDLPEFDCIVSPANSFGLMDGGVDATIIRFFGEQLMRRVQEYILREYAGEQPVGTSFITPTGHVKHPYLAHTPTMRVPMPIAGTDAVYRAMWAMLLTVKQYNAQQQQDVVQTVACPGLGTLTGRVPPHEAARLMAAAYLNFLDPPDRISWEYAIVRQRRVAGDLWPTTFNCA